MDRKEVAEVLEQIGILLEIQGENRFRCQAYYNAARAIEQLEEDLDKLITDKRLGQVRGIGSAMEEKITTLFKTGELPYYNELRQKTSPGLLELLRLPGVGPKKVKALYDELKVENLEQLKQACEQGHVASLKGFGDKTQQKILEGIQFLDQAGQRVRIDEALEVAEALLDGLRDCPGIGRMELCGSLRRRKETINDIDILVSSDTPGPIMERFVNLPGVVQVVGHGDTKSSIVVKRNLARGRSSVMNADLRVVREENFPFALQYFTGSKEHNVSLRGRAQQRGLRLNEYALAAPDQSTPCKDETELYRALDLDYVPPELRENTGEVEAAEQHRLPALIEPTDLQGTFHCHTTYSDGTATVREMAQAAQRLGLKYLGIADHSQSLTVAYGLTPDRVREQQGEIDQVNEKLKGFKVFKGTECDILPDGRLDFEDDLLETFDYVVASVHSHFNQTMEEMTARIIRAISNPRVTMLGHATGRLLLRRDGYKVDLEAVLQTAAKTGTLIEINAHPQRLDIDWLHCKRARALGVKMVINPDAHNMNDLAYIRFGVDVARRGWLQKGDVFNTLSSTQVSKALMARRAAFAT